MKKMFRILGMHCANCSMRIESIEDDLIEYDEKLVMDEQIIAAVKKKGYQAVPV